MATQTERPAGAKRSWTTKEWAQGRPMHRPTHPILVIFPIWLVWKLLSWIFGRSRPPSNETQSGESHA